ncbi:MAG: hypothetical protein JNM90_09990 [Burkholderiales bacterium]|nr:hypothetical protein [Burkholderiales bacterium]
MLFWIETDLDFSRVPDAAASLADERAALAALHARRGLLRVWRRINGRGVHAVVDFASPEALDDWLGAFPTYNAMQSIAVTALRAHRIFTAFAAWREAPGRAAGNLHLVRLAIDRARLEAARSPALVERAEANARRHVDDGQVLGIWREPHGSGAFIAWHSRDHDELFHELDTLPLKGYFRAVTAEPMLPLPGLEHLAGWQRAA